jgi:EAL and modified HD-GYP domain-containing signal transduction protein
VNALMDIGIEELVGRHNLAFINVDRELLLGDYCESLPQSRVVLEILETVEPDRDVVSRLKALRNQGYRISLDDFVCVEPYSALLEVADYVKLDLLASDHGAISRALTAIRRYHPKLIAEKVETYETVNWCRENGFDYFQGYFFCRPQNVAVKHLPANRLAMIHLLSRLNKPDLSIEELESAISQDLSLSYKLLRYINSAGCGLERRVDSIRHAIVLVGMDRIRIWANLILLSGFEEASNEVVIAGAIRARMCEILASTLQFPDPERFFLVGLFSVLDALLDRPMNEVLSLLPLSTDINDALAHYGGQLGAVLRCVQTYERREWDQNQSATEIMQQKMERAYSEAVAWCAGMVGLSSRQPGFSPA